MLPSGYPVAPPWQINGMSVPCQGHVSAMVRTTVHGSINILGFHGPSWQCHGTTMEARGTHGTAMEARGTVVFMEGVGRPGKPAAR